MAKARSQSRKEAGQTASSTSSPGINDTERQRMIAEAAYFRAMLRGFQGGSPTDDWLQAEIEITRLLPSPTQQKQEQAAYEKLRVRFQKLLGEARDTLTAETIGAALDQARAQLSQAGEHTVEALDKAAAAIEKELIASNQRLGARLEDLTERSADVFSVWRDRGAQFLAGAAGAVSEWVREAGERLAHAEYRTGDIATAGTLECSGCGQHIVLDTPAHVPLCPYCRKSQFQRVS